MRRWIALLAVAACQVDDAGDAGDSGDPAAEMPISLVEPYDWQVADLSIDLFASLRPADTECDELRGYYVYETTWARNFEVNTGWCNYVTLSQPLLEPLEPGDTVEIRVYHFELTGGPAEGYLGVGLGPEILWEQTVPIPSESELLKGTVEVTEAIDAGTPIQFHVHNHGSNTWELHSIDKISSGS